MSVIQYEQRRIRSIRSTWVTAAIVVLFGGLTALLFVTLAAGDPANPDTDTTTVFSVLYGPLVVVPLSVLAAMAFGGEYRFGMIRLTLTSFPVRTRVYFTKLAVVLIWMLAVLLVTWAVAVLLGFVFADNIDWDPFAPTNLAYAGRAMILALGYGIFVFALVVITRNQSLGIVIMLLWMLVIEGILGGFIAGENSPLRFAMPMTQAADFVATGSVTGLLVLLFWLVALVAAGWALLIRRDA